MDVTKDKLVQLQGEDPSLSKYMTKEAPLIKNGKEISHVKRKGILNRTTEKIDVEKEDEARIENEKEDLKILASAEMLVDEEMPSIDEDSLLELGTCKQKENVSDVKLGTELGNSQSRQLQALMENYADVFSDVPGRTSKIEHRINLVDEEPVCLKPYPLPYALRQELKDKIR